jgi:hypothetical protein
MKLTGSLGDADDRVLSLSRYTLSVDAADGDPADVPESGVASIRILLDGIEQGSSPAQTNAGDNATLSRTWVFPTDALANGSQHHLEVIATDRVGNSDSDAMDFTVDHLPSLAPTTISNPSAATNAATGSVGERLGQSLANIGDVNADGIDDFAVGAPEASPSTRLRAGTVYILAGTSSAGSTPAVGRVIARIDGDLAGGRNVVQQ